MRTEQEMFDLIINIAKQDKRIYAVYMNGSRTNQNAIKDIFQDYDIVYVVEETKSFRENKSWIDVFGERLYMQYPEDNGSYQNDVDNCYGWLIQFADGNRLDLHVCTLNYVLKEIHKDRLCKILLDKDNLLPTISEPTDEDYWVKRPTEKQFKDTCNEFWWCLNNVAKGLWREETPYAMDMINRVIRPQLIRILGWKIGVITDFTVSIGKSGKYMYRWLEKEEWETFLKTYSTAIVKDVWEAVFIMCSLFDDKAKELANNMDFRYDETEASNSLKFLKDAWLLPKTANKIY